MLVLGCEHDVYSLLLQPQHNEQVQPQKQPPAILSYRQKTSRRRPTTTLARSEGRLLRDGRPRRPAPPTGAPDHTSDCPGMRWRSGSRRCGGLRRRRHSQAGRCRCGACRSCARLPGLLSLLQVLSGLCNSSCSRLHQYAEGAASTQLPNCEERPCFQKAQVRRHFYASRTCLSPS